MKKFLQLHSRIKNKHDDGSDVAFFVSASITYSLVERLPLLAALLAHKEET